jgi:hypothetical protein
VLGWGKPLVVALLPPCRKDESPAPARDALTRQRSAILKAASSLPRRDSVMINELPSLPPLAVRTSAPLATTAERRHSAGRRTPGKIDGVAFSHGRSESGPTSTQAHRRTHLRVCTEQCADERGTHGAVVVRRRQLHCVARHVHGIRARPRLRLQPCQRLCLHYLCTLPPRAPPQRPHAE